MRKCLFELKWTGKRQQQHYSKAKHPATGSQNSTQRAMYRNVMMQTKRACCSKRLRLSLGSVLLNRVTASFLSCSTKWQLWLQRMWRYLPDNGDRLRTQIEELNQQLQTLDLQGKVLGNANAACHDAKSPHQTKLQSSSSALNQMSNGRPTRAMLIPAMPSTLHDGHEKCSAVKHALGTKDVPKRDFSRDVIERLYHCLETQPPSSQQATDPPGLQVSLLPHQKEALTWMLWREQQLPCGGILADDMGLGKTVTVIALLLSKRVCAQEELSAKHGSSELVGGTLVVCPASLLHHWYKEIERRTKPHLMTVVLYHGPQRTKDTKRLAKFDIVLTTYKIVALEAHGEDSENAEKITSSLVCVRWTRLILDEAHCIKNPKAQATMAICRLHADARWAVTGTPIQNNLMDLYSIFRFLRCDPFDDLQVWKSKVDSGTAKARERLKILVRSLLLHRTKDHLVCLCLDVHFLH
uniref:Transcription termination factor 2 n=1 Tax=Eptatretus burgeri TaxID=7764 RepID=A0A8C4QXF1_EPTBU